MKKWTPQAIEQFEKTVRRFESVIESVAPKQGDLLEIEFQGPNRGAWKNVTRAEKRKLNKNRKAA